MAVLRFRLPDIGEGVAEAEVVAWLVESGQCVEEDEPVVEVMTDKATVTIGAPAAGTVHTLCCEVGAHAKVGDVLFVLVPAGETMADASADETTGPMNAARIQGIGSRTTMAPDTSPLRTDSGAPEAPATLPDRHGRAAGSNGHLRQSPDAAAPELSDVTDAGFAIPSASLRERAQQAPQPPGTREDGPRFEAEAAAAAESGASAVGDLKQHLPGVGLLEARREAAQAAAESGRLLAAPAVRKLVRELKVDEARLLALRGGRITRADVLAAALAAETERGAPADCATPEPAASPAPRAPASADEVLPFVGLRRTMATRMRASKARAAHATFVEECRADALVAWRDKLNAERAPDDQLTFLPFFAKCVAVCLAKHRLLNAALDDAGAALTLHGSVHLGIAMATPQGLMVPVLRDVQAQSLLDLHEALRSLTDRARAGRLAPQELSGSTFTITSLGKLGGLLATPLLNPPEVGILGIHRMRRTAVVEGDALAIGTVMSLSLSFDHCVVDGMTAARFVYDLIKHLEAPEQLLLALR